MHQTAVAVRRHHPQRQPQPRRFSCPSSSPHFGLLFLHTGPLGDVGIKFNTSNGGPALEDLTDRIFAVSKTITRVLSTPSLPPSIDISTIGSQTFPGPFLLTVVSPTHDYFTVLQTCFDFPLIRQLLSRQDFRIRFDAMHAVTGPYARELFDSILSPSGGDGSSGSSSSSCCFNAVPLPDFGGGHPDPNLYTPPPLTLQPLSCFISPSIDRVYARALVDAMIADPSLCVPPAPPNVNTLTLLTN